MALYFIGLQASAASFAGATITAVGFAGNLEGIGGSAAQVASTLYDVWYTSGMNGGRVTTAKEKRASWKTWMGVPYRFIAPNWGCLMSNPLLQCAGIFTQDITQTTSPTKGDIIQAATVYIQNNGVWYDLISHGLCGYTILHQDNTPDVMFADLLGGKLDTDGQPFPCAGLGMQNELQFALMGGGLASTVSFFFMNPFMELAQSGGRGALIGTAMAVLLSLGATAGGAAGGYAIGRSRTTASGCDPDA